MLDHGIDIDMYSVYELKTRVKGRVKVGKHIYFMNNESLSNDDDVEVVYDFITMAILDNFFSDCEFTAEMNLIKEWNGEDVNLLIQELGETLVDSLLEVVRIYLFGKVDPELISKNGKTKFDDKYTINQLFYEDRTMRDLTGGDNFDFVIVRYIEIHFLAIMELIYEEGILEGGKVDEKERSEIRDKILHFKR